MRIRRRERSRFRQPRGLSTVRDNYDDEKWKHDVMTTETISLQQHDIPFDVPGLLDLLSSAEGPRSPHRRASLSISRAFWLGDFASGSLRP
jgi:hypothetical protein